MEEYSMNCLSILLLSLLIAQTELIEISGVSVVNEGATFSFHIKNTFNQNITVSFLNHSQSLFPNDSITYRLTAPQIDSSYQNVTYVFKVYLFLTNNHSEAIQWSINNTDIGNLTVDEKGVLQIYEYTLTVLDTDFIKKYEEIVSKAVLYTTLLVIMVVIVGFIAVGLAIERIAKFVKLIRKRK